MYLIDNTYFTGKYEIPSILEKQSGNAQTLNQFIDIEVPLFLQKVLGFHLFDELDSNINDGALISNAPQKWKDLVNGVIYNDNTQKWNGLIYSINGYSMSLLTNYIWCKFLDDRNRIDGNGNANVIESANAKQGSLADQYMPIWNEFINLSQSDCLPTSSLNQFLFDNSESYPTKGYIHQCYKNRFF